MEKAVWVLLEAEDNKVKTSSLALIEEGRRLANALSGGSVTAVFLGERIEGLNEAAGRHGARNLLSVKKSSFRKSGREAQVRILAQLISERKPFLVLAAATAFGSDLFSRVSGRIKAPLVTNCLEATLDNDLEFIKPIQNGRLHATLTCKPAVTRMATFIPDSLIPAQGKPPEAPADFFEIDPGIDTEDLPIIEKGFIKADHRTIDIEEAETVVAVGRGLGAMENLDKIKEFADRIGAAIAGTRPMVDARILPYDRQIGQTGKRIAPRLVFLCGISGAVEFIKGIEQAGTKLAINSDRDAAVFRSADVAILGDMLEVIPRISGIIGKQSRLE